MALNDITLTSGMRNNLVSLQQTTNLLNRTQERLSTGKKINSAIDNPTSFFVAKSHLQRASDLAVRKDGMGEAIQAVKAADKGVSAITALIEAAKGLAQTARSSDVTGRASLATQFDTLRTQMTNIANDSGYKGINLLGDDDLTVEFNENGSSALTVAGFDATTSGLAVAAAANSWATNTDIDTAVANLDAALSTLRTEASNMSSNLSVITVRDDFAKSMIDTLTEGADKLTLADMNEEGANMLMLQTRQALGTTALSLSAQAAQSVLRLF